jgi:glycine/D-amino acid oxidase-like deaminating enzyme
MSTSVIVVGGGLVGSAAAYFLAREGHPVTLLEMRSRGHGASGRNPGFVWLHCRNAGWALDISLAGRALYDELARDLPVPFEFRAEGGLIYFTDERQAPVFEQFATARRADGLDMTVVDGAEVRRMVGPIRPDVVGGSFCTNDAQINTPTVVNALVEGAIAEGATVLEGVEVTSLVSSGEQVVGVETDQGRFTADLVVLATGAWTRRLLAEQGLEVPIGLERLQVVATAPLPRSIGPVVYGPQAAKQYALFRDLPGWDLDDFTSEEERVGGDWLLPLVAQRANGEMLFGCPMDYPASVDLTATVNGVRRILQYVEQDFPSLATASLDRVWAGVLPFTSDLVPIIDTVRPGLVLAAGHVFGNAAGPITGKLLAQLVSGRTPDIDLTQARWDRPLAPVMAGQQVSW